MRWSNEEMWTGLLLLWTISEIIIALATRTPRSAGTVRDRGSQWILWVVIVASVTACEYSRRVSAGTVFDWSFRLRVTSMVAFAFGLAIRWIAIFNLGKAFSANVAIRSEQTINRAGLYRFVRHPSYAGLLLIFLAIGLHSHNWLGLAAAIVPPVAALLYRIHVEEAALVSAFGADYLSYCQKIRRLIPGVY